MLSKDISFKDLGLLIIDEEHRFGVMAKEKLRSLKANVDTLTLTATPIPRTLNLSLLGARDLSIIATPPPNRQPIYTKVDKFDIIKVREWVLNEVKRLRPPAPLVPGCAAMSRQRPPTEPGTGLCRRRECIRWNRPA